MTLTDTGPLVALIDKGDSNHARCVSALSALPSGGMITTWPCLTESAYLLRREGGWSFVAALWRYVDAGALRVHLPSESELQRIRNLMETYRDTPCDLADASLVAAAETLGITRIFSLDSHFRIYRMSDAMTLTMIP